MISDIDVGNIGFPQRCRQNNFSYNSCDCSGDCTGLFLWHGDCAENPAAGEHRSFIHSFLALFLLEISLWIVYSAFMIPFGVGLLSPLASDIFKRWKEIIYGFF